MSRKFLEWFVDMKARAFAQGIRLEPLTVAEIQTYS